MKKEILRLLNLRTEKEYQDLQNRFFKTVDRVTKKKDERFNKLIDDMIKDGIDVNRHLAPFERVFTLDGWDTSKMTKVDVSNMFADIGKTPFEKELEGIQFKHSGVEENNIKGKLRMLYNANRTEESEKMFNDLLDKIDD